MFYYIKWGLVWSVVALFAVVAHYSLPRWDVVRITDTYEKRVNPGTNSLFWAGADAGETMGATGRDVFFLQAMDGAGNPKVYRNQDTGWGWPFVFKFDTANVQAEAADLRSTAEAPKWVAVKHYGWRFEYNSVYPNALALKVVDGPDARIIPWVSIAKLIFVIMAIWAVTSRVLRLYRRYVLPIFADDDAS